MSIGLFNSIRVGILHMLLHSSIKSLTSRSDTLARTSGYLLFQEVIISHRALAFQYDESYL